MSELRRGLTVLESALTVPKTPMNSPDGGGLLFGTVIEGGIQLDSPLDALGEASPDSFLPVGEDDQAGFASYQEGDRVALSVQDYRPVIVGREGGIDGLDAIYDLQTNVGQVQTKFAIFDPDEATQQIQNAMSAADSAATVSGTLQALVDAGLVKASTTDPGVAKGLIWAVLDDPKGTPPSQRIIGMRIANPDGTAWLPYQIMVEELMVVGSDGTIWLKDGIITARQLAATIVLTSQIICGSADSWHTTLDPTGLHFFSKMIDGNVKELLKINSPGSTGDQGVVFGLIDPSTGNLNASITPSGDASFQSVTVPGNISAKTLVMDGDGPDTWVPEYAPHIIGAYKFSAANWGATWGGKRFINDVGWKRVLTVNWANNTGHDRVVWLPSVPISLAISQVNQAGATWAYTVNGTSPTANNTYSDMMVSPASGIYVTVTAAQQLILVPAGATLKACLDVYNGGFEWIMQSNTTVTVWDLGPVGNYQDATITPNTLSLTNGGGNASGGSTTKQTYVKTYAGNQLRTYYRDSGADWPEYAGQACIGSYNGTAARNAKGAIGFSSWASDLAGATVTKVEVCLYFSHWWSNAGGTAYVAPLSIASFALPSSLAGGSQMYALTTSKPGGAWITLPSSVNAGFQNGTYKGLYIYRDSNDVGGYGRIAIADWCYVRITYEK